jgi:hypothetical protein
MIASAIHTGSRARFATVPDLLIPVFFLVAHVYPLAGPFHLHQSAARVQQDQVLPLVDLENFEIVHVHVAKSDLEGKGLVLSRLDLIGLARVFEGRFLIHSQNSRRWIPYRPHRTTRFR